MGFLDKINYSMIVKQVCKSAHREVFLRTSDADGKRNKPRRTKKYVNSVVCRNVV